MSRNAEFDARAAAMGQRWSAEDAANGTPVHVAFGASAAMVQVADGVQRLMLISGATRAAEYLTLLCDQATAEAAPAAPSPLAS